MVKKKKRKEYHL